MYLQLHCKQLFFEVSKFKFGEYLHDENSNESSHTSKNHHARAWSLLSICTRWEFDGWDNSSIGRVGLSGGNRVRSKCSCCSGFSGFFLFFLTFFLDDDRCVDLSFGCVDFLHGSDGGCGNRTGDDCTSGRQDCDCGSFVDCFNDLGGWGDCCPDGWDVGCSDCAGDGLASLDDVDFLLDEPDFIDGDVNDDCLDGDVDLTWCSLVCTEEGLAWVCGLCAVSS